MNTHNEINYEAVNSHRLSGVIYYAPVPSGLLELVVEQPVSDFPEENLTFPAGDEIPPTIKFAETL
jgi:hypothetical protein